MALLRICKAILMGGLAFFFALVVFGNLTDYGSNFEFVHHVLAMDTTFSFSHIHYRAIQAEPLHHLFYATIIGWETLCLLAIGYGAWRLWSARNAPLAEFVRAKEAATVGLILSLLLWLVAFLCIGGEWFGMWQSSTWNGQPEAFRMFVVTSVILLFLWQGDVEPVRA